jgi:methionyl-tRNA formyltransferase
MRLVFMGTPQFALPSLERLLASDHQVMAVVTRPDRPRGRGLKEMPPPVKVAAQRAGLPVFQPEKLRDPEFVARLSQLQADLFVVVAFRILPREVFAMPPRGTIDLHPSLLPQYRGAAPINWAIINGETETGVSVFFIGEKIDAGELILQRKIPIEPQETAGELSEKLSRAGAEALLEAVDAIAADAVEPCGQTDETPSAAPKISREDGRIQWDRTALQIKNLIRGLNPKPGAYASLGGRTVKVFQAETAGPAVAGAEPGQIVGADPREGFFVNTADGRLQLFEVQVEGKRRMDWAEFLRGFQLRGHRLRAGDRFD